MKRIQIAGGPLSYEVLVGSDLLRRLDTLVEWSTAGRAILIADRGAAERWGEIVEASLRRALPTHRLLVEPGERSKSLDDARDLMESMAALGANRDDVVVTLGGGVVSDLGGFVASVYHRGLPVVHLPTTLVGQVDASVGGKTAVNLGAGKNLAGTFHHPMAVVADLLTLKTLPGRALLSGMAEVIKCGLALDPTLLETLERSRDALLSADPHALELVVSRCVEVKGEVVAADAEDRSGIRAALNYGHTFGHALEAAGGYARWSHGEAISVGMMFAAALAEAVAGLERDDVVLHGKVLESFGLPVAADFDISDVLERLIHDKKRRATQRWVLLEDLGKPVLYEGLASHDVEAAAATVRS